MSMVWTFIAIVAGVFTSPIAFYFLLRLRTVRYGLRRDPITGRRLNRPDRPFPNAAKLDTFDWRNILAVQAVVFFMPWIGARYYFGRRYLGPYPDWMHVTTMIAAASATLAFLGYAPHRLRWRRKTINAEYELCLECGFCLKGLPIKHICPECGTPYDLYVVKRTWTAWVRERI